MGADHPRGQRQDRLTGPDAYGAFVDKRGSNCEFQIGVDFGYARCPGLRKASAVDLIAQAWLGCKPFVDLVR